MKIFLVIVIMSLGIVVNAQLPQRVLKIDSLLRIEKYDAANRELDQQLKKFTAAQQYDSIPYFIRYAGNYNLSGGNWDRAIDKATILVDELKTARDSAAVSDGLLELAWIYYDASRYKDGYEKVQYSLDWIPLSDEEAFIKKTNTLYNTGFFASAMGDFELSKNQYVITKDYIEKNLPDNHTKKQLVYNALGGAMWNVGKTDSAKVYFKKATTQLNKMEPTLRNKYLRPGLLNMNLSVLHNIDGENQKAINRVNIAITQFNNYADKVDNEIDRVDGKNRLYVAMDNLGSYYNTTGNFLQAVAILKKSYELKKELLPSGSQDLLISAVILSQSFYNTKEITEAKSLLEKTVVQYCKNDQLSPYWRGAAYQQLAAIESKLKNTKLARSYYYASLAIYDPSKASSLNYDEFANITQMAGFYGANGDKNKAVELLNQLETIAGNADLKGTLREQNMYSYIAQAYATMKDDERALNYSKKAIDFNLIMQPNTTLNDSIAMQLEKPTAYFIQAAVKYKQLKDPTVAQLKEIQELIDSAKQLLEQRKQTITTATDLNAMLATSKELFTLEKQIQADRYLKTGKSYHINKLLEIHENSIYSKLRSQLSLHSDGLKAGVPTTVLEKERTLKETLENTLELTASDRLIYENARKKYDQFLEELKVNYPKYYQLRYATLNRPLGDFQKNLVDDETLIRYLFIEEDLYAIVITSKKFSLIKLNNKSLEKLIETAQDTQFDSEKTGVVLFQLYKQLWQPLENEINTSTVKIIPDGLLFNLNFESLVNKLIYSYEELVAHSLLNQHTISYYTTLFELESKQATDLSKNDYIAYAPAFNESMKTSYTAQVSDSLPVDSEYLNLLPQPFSRDLIDKASAMFTGSSFTENEAHKSNFLQNASGHKILHIGTHAFSNNISPSLSRLIFAKNLDNPAVLEDNTVYAYELYNHDLNADLSILTACETGKPTYQPGEGMISLSHAFTYAGSKSLLTSLWQVDEQSSAQIVDYFYTELEAGTPKNKALQNAKLRYLKTATGRTRSPQYWAGLVLSGDTSAMDLASNSTVGWYIFFGLLALGLLIIVGFLYKQRARS